MLAEKDAVSTKWFNCTTWKRKRGVLKLSDREHDGTKFLKARAHKYWIKWKRQLCGWLWRKQTCWLWIHFREYATKTGKTQSQGGNQCIILCKEIPSFHQVWGLERHFWINKVQAVTEQWILGFFSQHHTPAWQRWVQPDFVCQFRCLTCDVNLSAEWFNIVPAAMTDFQTPLKTMFLPHLQTQLTVGWAAWTQCASCLLLREPLAHSSRTKASGGKTERILLIWICKPQATGLTVWMNLCHHTLPSLLGRHRTHTCRKPWLFPLPVRGYQ